MTIFDFAGFELKTFKSSVASRQHWVPNTAVLLLNVLFVKSQLPWWLTFVNVIGITEKHRTYPMYVPLLR